MKTTILLTTIYLLFTINCFSQPKTDTLTVAISETESDSVDLNGLDLLAIQFPATMTSDTVFIQDKNLKTGTFQDVYYTSSEGEVIRTHIVVQAGAKVFINPMMTFGLGRYARFVTIDAEAAARGLISFKGHR